MIVSCPICKNKKWEIFLKLDEFNILRCKFCGIKRKEFEKDLNFNFEDWYNKDYFSFLVEKREFFKKDLHFPKIELIKKFKKNGKFLDIGCGLGIAVEIALEEGFDVWATDVSSYAISYVKEKFNIPCYKGEIENAPFPQNFFDVIYIHHVLEHVIEPVEFLKKVKKFLNKDGIILIAVPNIKSIYLKIYRKNFHIFQKEHLWYFDIFSLRKILKKVNLKLCYYKTNIILETQLGWISICLNNITSSKNFKGLSMNFLRKIWRLFSANLRSKIFKIFHKLSNFIFSKLKIGDDLLIIVKK